MAFRFLPTLMRMPMPSSPELLILIPLADALVAQLRDNPALPVVRYAPKGVNWLNDEMHSVSIVLTNGSTGLTRAQMQAMPQLKLISAFGAGVENVDLTAAKELGIAVTHAPGANNATVADHAMALMLRYRAGCICLMPPSKAAAGRAIAQRVRPSTASDWASSVWEISANRSHAVRRPSI